MNRCHRLALAGCRVDRDFVYSDKPASVTLNVIEDPRNYMTRYRGTYLYLDRYDYGTTNAICRLKYTGNIKDWEFAIFKYSNEKYDPDEWFFAGSEFVDGTIQGAMKAGLQAYPS